MGLHRKDREGLSSQIDLWIVVYFVDKILVVLSNRGSVKFDSLNDDFEASTMRRLTGNFHSYSFQDPRCAVV